MTVTPRGRLMGRRRHLPLIGAMILIGGVLAACATLVGPRERELPLSRLQQGLDKRFPIDRQVMSVFNLKLTRPQLSLLPDTDRVALSLDADVAPPFAHRTWHGSVALSGHLVLDAARNAVLITEVKLDRISIDGVDASRQQQFADVANGIVGGVVGDTPIYTFHPEDLRFAGVQFMPTGIRTKADALVVTFAPAQ
jgi:hypothetical protein